MFFSSFINWEIEGKWRINDNTEIEGLANYCVRWIRWVIEEVWIVNLKLYYWMFLFVFYLFLCCFNKIII